MRHSIQLNTNSEGAEPKLESGEVTSAGDRRKRKCQIPIGHFYLYY